MRSPPSCIAQQLLDSVRPFQIGSGCIPVARDLRQIERLAGDLERLNCSMAFAPSFTLLDGMWRCVFTDSRYVLGLDKIPLVSLTGVYQKICVHANSNSGHYFNIGEMSRANSVKLICGERAHIAVSNSAANRIDLDYEYFYMAPRIFKPYEGQVRLAEALGRHSRTHAIRIPFRKSGWQSVIYLDSRLRVIRGNEGGLFVLTKNIAC